MVICSLSIFLLSIRTLVKKVWKSIAVLGYKPRKYISCNLTLGRIKHNWPTWNPELVGTLLDPFILGKRPYHRKTNLGRFKKWRSKKKSDPKSCVQNMRGPRVFDSLGTPLLKTIKPVSAMTKLALTLRQRSCGTSPKTIGSMVETLPKRTSGMYNAHTT